MQDVLVIGCGVSGLSSAIRLREAGCRVSIIARELPPNTTSDRAAAFWYPYRAYPMERVLPWARRSLEVFELLAAERDSGVAIREMWELFAQRVDDPWWKGGVTGFRRLSSGEIIAPYVDGFSIIAACIETPRYLRYLMDSFKALGGSIEQGPVSRITELRSSGALIVNCSGLGSLELFGDATMFPIRGQVVRVTNPGIKRAILDEQGPRALSYIIPRSDDCILGGTATENDWNVEPDAAMTRQMIERCRELDPALERAEFIETYAGLRPGRPEVRLEVERIEGMTVVHNYGHGGAGFTLSWGCAEEVARLVGSQLAAPR